MSHGAALTVCQSHSRRSQLLEWTTAIRGLTRSAHPRLTQERAAIRRKTFCAPESQQPILYRVFHRVAILMTNRIGLGGQHSNLLGLVFCLATSSVRTAYLLRGCGVFELNLATRYSFVKFCGFSDYLLHRALSRFVFLLTACSVCIVQSSHRFARLWIDVQKDNLNGIRSSAR